MAFDPKNTYCQKAIDNGERSKDYDVLTASLFIKSDAEEFLMFEAINYALVDYLELKYKKLRAIILEYTEDDSRRIVRETVAKFFPEDYRELITALNK